MNNETTDDKLARLSKIIPLSVRTALYLRFNTQKITELLTLATNKGSRAAKQKLISYNI